MSATSRDLTTHASQRASQAILDAIGLTDTPQEGLAVALVSMSSLVPAASTLIEQAIPEAKQFSDEDRVMATITAIANILAMRQPDKHRERMIEILAKRMMRVVEQEIGRTAHG